MTESIDRTQEAVESVDSFRARARAWLATSMPLRTGDVEDVGRMQNEQARLAHHRELQRRLYDGGFAGICFPREYGGQGLGLEHQQAFNEECEPYELPVAFNVPTLGVVAATLLDCANEEQKRRHIPAILRGDEYWIQFLSEPSGGSDVAGALTSAVRDGDEWVINGSKVWSTRAYQCDYALCLVRTNWDVPKHSGLTVVIMEIHQPGVEVRQIEMLNGSLEFCEEFFTDVRVPLDAVVGEIDNGWKVATRWMYHERIAVGGGSPYVSGKGGDDNHGPDLVTARHAHRCGVLHESRVRALVGEAYAYGVIQDQLIERVTAGMRRGALPESAATMLRLFRAEMGLRTNSINFEIAGERGAVWSSDDAEIGAFGIDHLMRQSAAMGGGTTEMARNVISERMLGMPREPTLDRELPFRDVRKNATAR